jgi:lipoprotein-releasing system ATP-binding protein
MNKQVLNSPVLECQDLAKYYKDGQNTVNVFQQLQCTVHAGERIAIVGPSGSGKSTLLHLMGGLDNPSAGAVLLQGHNWRLLSETARCRLRNQNLGFVYQFHHLLPEFSALENVALPLLLAGITVKEATARAEDMLKQVGLSGRLQHIPAQLSGGERQRVAIARALVHRPACVLADEPTGNLDRNTAQQVFEVMLQLNAEYNTALVVVTHDLALAGSMDRIMTLPQG